MKITFNWLKQYVDFDWTPEQLSERLTMLGIEVEGVDKIGGEFEGIVVAQVLSRDKVTGSDKLSVCKVNDGKGERQIICGAQNFQAGDKVPLILPNFALPMKAGEKTPFVIKIRKVMGVESHGMLCSPQELGLPDAVDGLLILKPDAKVGQPFAEYLGRAGSDVVYDLEITPNRPDLNSLIGIAREVSAITGNPLKFPELPAEAGSGAGKASAKDLVSVRIEDAELCPRYNARVVRGVKIGPSPAWLRGLLEKVGIRSISNVVDVTNFVMLEAGQPLHAFDYHLISKPVSGASALPAIIIRRAREGEPFTTLDNTPRALNGDMLLIADEQKGIALAGVMGGQNTEINDKTVDVLIESACFKPGNIRATSKKLGLRTDASYRFERGSDIGICDWASRRAAQLILETAGGELAGGSVDAFPVSPKPKQITLRHHKVTGLLGIQISAEANLKFLRQLGLEATADASGQSCVVTIPTFRVDLKHEADLIEEIVRLYGVDNIPGTAPRGAFGANEFDAIYDQFVETRHILAGLGLDEAQGQTLISETSAKFFSANPVALENPLSADMNVLRPSLLPGLLDSLKRNLNHKNNDLALFEVGRVFNLENGKTREERRVAIVLTGHRNPPYWTGDDRDANFDTYDLKGRIEGLLEKLGLRGASYSRRGESSPLWLESATVHLGKNTLGELGQLTPVLAKQYDLRDAVPMAELNLDLLLSLSARNAAGKSFKPLPAFPSVRRDVAMLVPEATTHEAVLMAVKQAKPANLESIELFDVFRGQNVPAGQKSLAYAFTYRNAEHTLTDAEVNAAHEKLVEQFKQRLNATVRE